MTEKKKHVYVMVFIYSKIGLEENYFISSIALGIVRHVQEGKGIMVCTVHNFKSAFRTLVFIYLPQLVDQRLCYVLYCL